MEFTNEHSLRSVQGCGSLKKYSYSNLLSSPISCYKAVWSVADLTLFNFEPHSWKHFEDEISNGYEYKSPLPVHKMSAMHCCLELFIWMTLMWNGRYRRIWVIFIKFQTVWIIRLLWIVTTNLGKAHVLPALI